MNVLLKINKGIGYVEKTIMVIAVIVMASVLFANVVGRVVFHHSVAYAEEVGVTGTIYITFIGLSYCAMVGEHITMTAIYDALKGKVKKVLTIIICLVLAVALAYLGYIALQYIMQLKMQGKSFAVLGYPLWIAYIIMPVFIWCASFRYITILLMNLTNKGGEAINCIERVVIASVDTEEADEELEEEFLESLEAVPEADASEEGGAN